MRLITHFERRGYNTEILNIFYPKVNNDINGNFAQSFIEVLIARQRFLTILDSKAFFYITCLENVLTIPEFKEKFLSLNVTKFIPEETLKMPGSKIDRQSPLGLFLRLSVMGNLYDYFHQEK